MNWLDWTVVVAYLLFLIGVGAYLNRYQENTDDYFLAGQRMKWWQTGFSTMATQLSAISFISVPAFVALKKGGGIKWLAYEVAVPIALIVVMVVIIPVLHRGRYISMHQYLGERFDEKTRSLVSGLFLLMRGLASGVIIYGGAKILAATFKLPTLAPESFLSSPTQQVLIAILIIGVVTIIYDVLGGIGVVIFSDVLQMFVIVVGLLICGWIGLDLLNWNAEAVVQAYDDPARFRAFDFRHWGVSKEEQYAFWPFLIGGFFLYVAYYGCDQSQVQREMSVANEDDVRKSMLLNAFGRYPIVLLYCLVGLVVGATFLTEAEAIAGNLNLSVETFRTRFQEHPDWMLPLFIRAALPHGLIGLLFVAAMAALMSSLDSAINSLSAVTIRDFYQEYLAPGRSTSHYLRAGQVCTLLWGLFATGSALAFALEPSTQTVVEQINQIGTMFYGPLAAAFLMGLLTEWMLGTGVFAGVVVGMVTNILVWQLMPYISWLWWGPIGFLTTLIVAVVITLQLRAAPVPMNRLLKLEKANTRTYWLPAYVLCIVYFFAIILLSTRLELGLMNLFLQ